MMGRRAVTLGATNSGGVEGAGVTSLLDELLLPILLIANLLHPVNDLAVELFLNGYVRHGRGWRRTMPVLLAWREPDHITWPDFFNRIAFALHPAAARRDNERLTKRCTHGVAPGSNVTLAP